MSKSANKIIASVFMTPKWFKDEFGFEAENPFNMDLDLFAEKNARRSQLLYDKYPELNDYFLASGGLLPIGKGAPEISYSMPQYDGRVVCNVAYGSKDPVWDKATSSFWYDRDSTPWADMKTASDVSKIKMPKWEDVSLIRQMQEKYDELKSKSKYQKDLTSSWTAMNWKNPNTGMTYHFTNIMSFIDLGGFLCGDTEFLMILASDRDLAKSLMEKCFELAVSYSEYMMKIFGAKPVQGTASLGGDFSCMLSPDMYQDYAMAFDQMKMDKYGNLPCNLHSCGASAHLYEIWGTYPNLDNIVLMQTRGIEGKLSKLRESLPDTFLQITIHQPQFDFENESEENIRRLVWQYAKEAGFRDLELNVIVAKTGIQVDKNIRAFCKTVAEINEKIRSGETDVAK